MNPLPRQGRFSWSDAIVRRAVVLGGWVYGCLGVATLVHLATPASAMSSLSAHLLGLAYGWWIAISFVLLQIALGRRLLGTWLEEAFGPNDALSLWLAELTVGFWATTIVLQLLAGLGCLDWPWLTVYLIGSAIAVLSPVRISWQSLRARLALPLDRQTLVLLALVVAAVLIWLPFLVQSLLPDSDWDGASTHLPLASWFRTEGLTTIPLDHVSLIIPGSVHLVYAAFQALHAEQAILPLNLLISVLVCIAGAAIADRFWSRKAGVWAFFAGLSTNLVLELGLDSRIDGFLGLFCAMAALGIMVWLLEGWSKGSLVLSAMALGIALGTKYTAVFPLLLWCAPVVWTLIRTPEARKGARRWGVVLAVLSLTLPAGYWYASNSFRFGDPIYPLLRGHVAELGDGLLVPLVDALDELIAVETASQDYIRALEVTTATPPEIDPPRTLFNPVSLFLYPELHGRKAAHTLSPLLLAFFVLPLLDRHRASWLLLWMGSSAFLAIGSQSGLMRYGLPFYPLFAAGAGVAISKLRSRWWQCGWVAVLVSVLAINLVDEWRKDQVRSSRDWLQGGHRRVEWLETVGYNGSRVLPKLISDMDDWNRNGVLPYDGAALLLGEGKTHLFPIEAIPDTSRTGRPWLSRLIRHGGNLEAVHRELWEAGVRYVVLNMGYFEWVRDNTGVDQEVLVFSLFKLQQFQRAFGSVLFDDHGVYIIRLRTPSARSVP